MYFYQSAKYGDEDSWKEIFSFVVETLETAVKSWHQNSTLDPRTYFLIDKDKTDTEKYAPMVNIDKVFSLFHNITATILIFQYSMVMSNMYTSSSVPGI